MMSEAMKAKIFMIVALVVAPVLAGVAHAQDPQQPSQPPTSGGTQSFDTPPSSLDTQGIKKYLLGPGDVLDIRVFGQPDLSSTVQVDGDGNLSSLPFLETPVRAKCRTEKPAASHGLWRSATGDPCRDETKGSTQRVDGGLGRFHVPRFCDECADS